MEISNKLKVFGGPRPTKGLVDLQKQGIKRIVSLQSGAYQSALVLINDKDPLMYQYPCEMGMAQYEMPMSDVTAPDRAYVGKILKLVADGMPTFIHCESGVDRTGFVAAVIRMRYEGWTYDQALAWWKTIRHPWYFIWNSALKEWAS